MPETAHDDVNNDDPAEQGRYGDRDMPSGYRRDSVVNADADEADDERQSDRVQRN
jgi:hypothetical protein